MLTSFSEIFSDIGVLSIEIDDPTLYTFEFSFEKSKASSNIASMYGLRLG